jgi:hypothetical protein
MARHDYATADRLLGQAESIDARNRDVIAARGDLRTAEQQTGQDPRRIEGLVTQARAAMARHDYATANRLLDQAAAIDAHDREVLQARTELSAAQRPGSDRGPMQR